MPNALNCQVVCMTEAKMLPNTSERRGSCPQSWINICVLGTVSARQWHSREILEKEYEEQTEVIATHRKALPREDERDPEHFVCHRKSQGTLVHRLGMQRVTAKFTALRMAQQTQPLLAHPPGNTALARCPLPPTPPPHTTRVETAGRGHHGSTDPVTPPTVAMGLYVRFNEGPDGKSKERWSLWGRAGRGEGRGGEETERGGQCRWPEGIRSAQGTPIALATSSLFLWYHFGGQTMASGKDAEENTEDRRDAATVIMEVLIWRKPGGAPYPDPSTNALAPSSIQAPESCQPRNLSVSAPSYMFKEVAKHLQWVMKPKEFYS